MASLVLMPSVVLPMLPTLVKAPFSDPKFLFEPKWDGYRAICFVEDGTVRFSSKNLKTLTDRFPELQGIGKSIKAESAVLDVRSLRWIKMECRPSMDYDRESAQVRVSLSFTPSICCTSMVGT
jgi:ATP-dependent DNA ligase